MTRPASPESRPLTILQVSEFYPPIIGGLERMVQGLTQELAARGHHVAVAVPTAAGAAVTLDGGVEVHHLRTWSGPVLARLSTDPDRVFHPTVPDPGMTRGLQLLVDELRPDIIHLHGWAAYSALALPRAGRARFVLTLHDHSLVCANRTYLNDGRPCDGARLGKCIACNAPDLGLAKAAGLASGLRAARALHRRLDAVVAVSSAVAEIAGPELRRAGVPVHVIPNWLPTEAEAGAGPGGPGLPAAGFALFVGSLGRHKGLDVLLDAHRLGLGLPLVVAGVPTTTTPATWPDGVTVLHNVEHRVVMELWARCRVGVVPSVWVEPFGLVALEAMAAGKPVVASAIGGLPDIVEHGVTGTLVPPGNATALAEAIRSLASDPQRAAAMGERGRQRVEQFRVAPVVDRIETLYRSLQGRRHTAADGSSVRGLTIRRIRS